MPRADLHYALVLDREIWEASQVDPSLLDPVVRVEGAIPGVSRPVVVVRDYQGPVGDYIEQVVLHDKRGRELARTAPQRIRLSGEMFEDRFTTVFDGLEIRDYDEQQATFYIDDEEVATIPVFVESGAGGDPRVAAEETFKKALQKGSVIWLTVPQPPQRDGRGRAAGNGSHTQAVWFVFDSGKVYVFDGPTEQQVPGLTSATEVEITARSKDHRSRVSQVRADVRRIPPDDPLFDKIARAGLGRRLNLPDGDGALERWRANCTLLELTPRFREDGEEAAAPRAAAGGAAAAAPAAAEAAEPGAAPAKKAEEDIHVEAQIDQEVYDQLIAEGKSERIARAKAKAAYVRKEKARIRAEREAAGT
ncbi:MAG TPA: hypothetical protein VIL46_15560 [Gemmataceae bacterium]